MFGGLLEVSATQGHGRNWMVHLKDNISAFRISYQGWRKAAVQMAGRWFRRVEEGTESFMWKLHDAGSCRAAGAERYINAAATP